MVIGLDLYLGNDFDTYRRIGIPEYLKMRLNRKCTSKDVADAFEALVGAMSLELGSDL